MYLTTSHATAEQVTRAVEHIAAQRVLFGTDSVGEAAQGKAVVDLLEALRETLAPEAFARVTGGNALDLERARQRAR